MPSITALLHTENDALRLGRCLETLYPCDEILIVDHGSHDGTSRLAREYGARVLTTATGASADDHYLYLELVRTDWILYLDSCESLTEGLAASLFEWKTNGAENQPDAGESRGFAVSIREETTEGWTQTVARQVRLVPKNWNHWKGRFPGPEPSATTLEGEILRFIFP